MKTFPIGGVHPSENKLSGAKPIEVLPLPDAVAIPLAQHIGAPAVPVVTVGLQVHVGDLLGEIPEGAMGARVHASISGTIRAVENGFITIRA